MITLSTSIYERNFVDVLSNNHWFVNYTHEFITEKIIVVNNIDNLDLFYQLKCNYPYIQFLWHHEYVDQINQQFRVGLQVSNREYYYSVHHYASLLHNTTNKFLFSVLADCTIISDDLTSYLERSIKLLNEHDDVITTTLPWFNPTLNDDTNDYAKEKMLSKRDTFYDGFCPSVIFSDQLWITKIDKIKQCDLTDDRDLYPFPWYAGASFEKRLANHFMTHNKYRAIYQAGPDYYKHSSY